MTTVPTSILLFCCLGFALCTAQPSSDCPFQDENVKVRWDNATQTCIPAVCNGGAQLSDIPDASGHLSASLACKMELVDTAGAHECLRGMRIVMLGDSTMTETMHDLVLLLAGLGSRPVEMADVIYKATRQNGAHTEMWVPLEGMPHPYGVQVDFYGSHRNMTITVPFLDTVIRHRFVGHVNLGDNAMGILTFTHPDFQAELACLLGDPAAGAGCGLRRPDVLVVNTGMHDMALPFPAFAMAMRELAARLRALQDLGVHVLWRGNNLLPNTHGMDIVSRHYVQEQGLAFVNTAGVMAHFGADLAASGCCADASGVHIGAIAAYHNASARVTISSMVTQDLLRHMCGRRNAAP